MPEVQLSDLIGFNAGNNLRGQCVNCGDLTEVVNVNSTRRSGSWMHTPDGVTVWPSTWIDMWADRDEAVYNAPTSPSALTEGEVLQSDIFTSLVDRHFHFDPCCPYLAQGVDPGWYERNTGINPSLRNRLGAIDVEAGRALGPCPQCAERFIRLSKGGR